MTVEQLTKQQKPTLGEVALYRYFGIRLADDYPDWVKADIRSGGWVRHRALWWFPLIVAFNVGVGSFNGFESSDLAIVVGAPVGLLLGVVLMRRQRAARGSKLFWCYQIGEITRREYNERMFGGPVPWSLVVFALSIPVVTLIVWLLLR